MSMNIKLHLTEDGELVDAGGSTLEFVLKNEEVLLKEEGEEKLSGKQQSQQQQVCTRSADGDRTEASSADSCRTPDSKLGPEISP